MTDFVKVLLWPGFRRTVPILVIGYFLHPGHGISVKCLGDGEMHHRIGLRSRRANSAHAEESIRPQVSVVSGVSPGALIAPYALLGSAYDASLRGIYTSGIVESLIDAPILMNALFGSGLFGNTRLRGLAARYVDRDLLAAIAAEHAKGKRLLIVSTNLDTQRTAIWDMSRIASIGSPLRQPWRSACQGGHW